MWLHTFFAIRDKIPYDEPQDKVPYNCIKPIQFRIHVRVRSFDPTSQIEHPAARGGNFLILVRSRLDDTRSKSKPTESTNYFALPNTGRSQLGGVLSVQALFQLSHGLKRSSRNRRLCKCCSFTVYFELKKAVFITMELPQTGH